MIKLSEDDERSLDETIEGMEFLVPEMIKNFQYGSMTAANALNWLLKLRAQANAKDSAF